MAQDFRSFRDILTLQQNTNNFLFFFVFFFGGGGGEILPRKDLLIITKKTGFSLTVKKKQWFFVCFTRWSIVTPLALREEIEKNALFSIFLIFFTFARRTKKITLFFFCKKFDEKMHKKLLFSLSKFTFFTLCFNSRK